MSRRIIPTPVHVFSGIGRRTAFLFLLPVILAVFVSPLAAEVPVTGRVLAKSGNPAADARVIILETRTSTNTDASGRFKISTPAPGFYTFRIIIGEEILQIRREIQYAGQVLEFATGTSSSPGAGETQQDATKGIEVVGFRDKTKLSRYRLTGDEMKRVPGAYGDSLKAVNTLPGVSPAPPVGVLPSVNILSTSFLSGFSIGPPYHNSGTGFMTLRGAGPRANDFYLDGFKIMYPFHLGDQSSVLNNDFIKAVDIYTGAFPVRFGNATGGVISIEGPSKAERFGGHVNTAMFLSDIFFDSPFIDKSGFIAVSARQSYPNVALLTLYPDAIPQDAKYAQYGDGQAKMMYRLGNHELSGLAFGAHDVLKYTKAVADAANRDSSATGGLGSTVGNLSSGGTDLGTNGDSRPPVGLDRSFFTEGLKYAFSYKGLFRNTLLAEISGYKESFQLDFRSPFTGETIFGFDVQDNRRETRYRDDLQAELIENHLSVNAGVESTFHVWEMSLRNFSPRRSVNPNTPSFIDTINDLVDNNRTFRALYDGDHTTFALSAAWTELEIEFWRLRLTPGVRTEYFSLSKDTGVGPRMNAELKIDETNTTILAGAGRHYNVPTTLEQVSVEAGNNRLKMEQSDHLAVGGQQKWGKAWTFKIEGFHNTFSNLVVEDRFEVAPYSLRTNKRDLVERRADIAVHPFEGRPLNYSNDATGFSKGYELFIQKTRAPGENGLFGWISYTRSITKRNNHQTRLTTDQQNDLNARNLNRQALATMHKGPLQANYYSTGELEVYYDNDQEELFDLDRDHQISMVANYKFNSQWQLGGRFRYASNVPYTPIVGNQTTAVIVTIPTFIPKYSDAYNSARLPPVHELDLRLDRFLNYEWGHANYYVELINFYAHRNAEQENFNFLRPYVRKSNPSTQYESTYIQTPTGSGRILLLPLLNVGIEIKF